MTVAKKSFSLMLSGMAKAFPFLMLEGQGFFREGAVNKLVDQFVEFAAQGLQPELLRGKRQPVHFIIKAQRQPRHLVNQHGSGHRAFSCSSSWCSICAIAALASWRRPRQ